MNAQNILKDLGFGLIVAAVLAVITIRCIELYARSDFAKADVSAEERLASRQAAGAYSCEPRIDDIAARPL